MARYQKKSSDKGKFIDMVVDNLINAFLILGLIWNLEIGSVLGASLIYLLLLAITFSIILNSRNMPSDWLFHARAGCVAHTPRYLLYFAYVLFVFNFVNILSEIVIFGNIYLIFLCGIEFGIIFKKI